MNVFRRFSMMPDLVSGNYVQRFYSLAGVKDVDTGYQVVLDGRLSHTPEKQPFVIKSQALALAVAQEWQQQEKFILKKRMPLMNLCARALDLPLTKQRPQIKSSIIEILKNDALCYREDDKQLRQEQEKLFSPVLKHIKELYSIEIPEALGLSEPDFSDDSLQLFEQFFDSKHSFYIVALEAVSLTTKSVAIALGLFDGVITLQQAVNCSRIEDNLQAAEFGKVEGIHDVNDAYELMVLAAAKNLVNMSGSDFRL